MRVVIVANGEIEDERQARIVVRSANKLICADGGTRHVLAWGIRPDIIVGDMDSLDESTLAGLLQAGVEVERHPSQKNETDLQLALARALREGATEIIILGALGGRLDQTLSNILLLTWEKLADLPVRILAGREEVVLVRDTVTLHGRPGDVVSLLPLTPTVEGITTDGLEYPMKDEPLFLGLSRGVSNVMLGQAGHITVRAGLLLVIHTRSGVS